MAEVNMDSFKPNSSKYKQEHEEKRREKVDPVVKKSAIVSTKKPFSRKIFDLFIGEDVEDIKDYVIKDLIIPGLQNALIDTMCMMFGQYGNRGKADRYSTGRFSYGSCYRGSRREREDKDRHKRFRERDRYEEDERIDYRNIRLNNREDAEAVIDHMRDRIHDTGSVSVAEFFDMLELPSKWTDNDWGWTDERDIGMRKVNGSFLIDVTEARRID